MTTEINRLTVFYLLFESSGRKIEKFLNEDEEPFPTQELKTIEEDSTESLSEEKTTPDVASLGIVVNSLIIFSSCSTNNSSRSVENRSQ
jgi:hypothetical protein